MNEVLLILGMTVVTFGVRYPVLALLGQMTLPPAVMRGLKYVPAAVLTAIVAPAMMMPDGQVQPTPENAHLIGGLVAVLVAWRSKSLLATIVLGMAAFLVWRALLA